MLLKGASFPVQELKFLAKLPAAAASEPQKLFSKSEDVRSKMAFPLRWQAALSHVPVAVGGEGTQCSPHSGTAKSGDAAGSASHLHWATSLRQLPCQQDEITPLPLT